ncbi:ceramide-binding protein Svf1p [Monosporozyma unispora]|nr:putative cell survival pathways protein [Kazachstania unispora]
MLKWIQGGISAVTGIAEPEYGKEYIHTVTERLEGKQPYREATRDDFCWKAPEFTNVETATFYFSDAKSGITGFAQIIHSNVLGMRTAAQFTFRIFNAKNPEDLNLWTSTKLNNFRVDGPNFYADDLSVELSEDDKTFHFVSNVCEQSKIDIYFTRCTPAVKAGDDPTTYYGDNLEEPWGSMSHQFWPRNIVHGTMNLKIEVPQEDDDEEDQSSSGDENDDGKEEQEQEQEGEGDNEEQEDEEQEEDDEEESSGSDYDSDSDYDDDYEEIEKVYRDETIEFLEEEPSYGMFVKAFQGMKPHHAAKAWNFCVTHSDKHSVVLMEFITPKSYGSTKVSVGIVTSKDEVLAVCLDNDYQHLNAEVDEVGWEVPKNIKVCFNGYSTKLTDEQIADKESLTDKDKVTAVLEGPFTNLVERVDVMGEVPGFVKNIVSGVAGTKPFIYQYADENFTLQVNNSKKEDCFGWAEVTFISKSDTVTEESYDEK